MKKLTPVLLLIFFLMASRPALGSIITDLRTALQNFSSIFGYNLVVSNFGRLPATERKVLVLNFNPIVNGQRLNSLLGWNNPDTLISGYISDVDTVSHQTVQYKIVETQVINDFPVKADGFQYTSESYLNCWNNHATCHSPDLVNYQKILTDYQVCEKLNAGQIDEMWMFGSPWFGYWEAVMTGPGAYFTNAPPLSGTTCQKKLNIMGFSYQRGVSEMLEDLGHRIEGTMAFIFGEDPRWPGTTSTNWGKFVKSCGWMHYAPNSVFDYDWANTTNVTSNCEDWLNYPNLTGATETFNCTRWNCDGYLFKKWWLTHLPHVEGSTDGKLNNWWKYVLEL